MLLPNGVYFRLETPELLRLRELIEEARALGEIEGDRVNAGSHNVTLWEELLTLGVVDEQVAKLAGEPRTAGRSAAAGSVERSQGLDATLRDYQRDGLNWLSFLWDNGLGGVLADDMGLGKTVQTLALIARAAEAGPRRFLVVAPTSVVTNWLAECRKFTPGLTAVARHRAPRARSGTSLAERVAGADVVITVICADAHRFRGLRRDRLGGSHSREASSSRTTPARRTSACAGSTPDSSWPSPARPWRTT